MKKYLYAVQDENGREVLAAEVETDKVSSVKATFDGDEIVLQKDGDTVAKAPAEPARTYRLHRWPADDKLSEPVSKTVSAPE